jgi:hypothetical protein
MDRRSGINTALKSQKSALLGSRSQAPPDAWSYLKNVLTTLPTWSNSSIDELLPYR